MIVTNFEDGYTIKRVVLATPKRLFESWLDDREHGDMTGGRATIDAAVNGPLSLLDGAVVGRTVGTAPYQGIVHELNTTEAWEAGSVTRVEVSLATGPHYGGIGNPQDDGTTIILRHTGVDAGGSVFSPDWWEDRYFGPMDAYFAAGNNRFTRPEGSRGT
jgi:activator of HSP90 ATPase